MGRATPATTPKETRLRRLSEVSLGFNKKIAQDEARRCPQCAVATCLPGCPLGIDIPGFIRFLREGDVNMALDKIKKENPFPSICGRICPAPCETACVFHADGSPIAIRNLERFASDHGTFKAEKASPSGDKKVAIIGSGPAGMSAAYFLAKANIGVTIFEAAHEPGGLLRYGVPEFRLPQKILNEEFVMLKALGVDIQTDAVVGHNILTDELFMRGFSALLIATGASLPRFLTLPGCSLAGVYYDTEFLNRLQIRAKEDALSIGRQQMLATPQVVIIGKGPSAFDAARLARRLGSEVHVVFDGFEEEAGVGGDILEESKEEGIEIHSLKAFEIVGNAEGYAVGVKCHKMEIIEGKDGLSLALSQEEPIVLEAQTVVLAHGYRSSDGLKRSSPQLKWDANGLLCVDGQTGMTSMDKIFGVGQVVDRNGSVVDAIAAGKAVAGKIVAYLGKS